MDCILHAGDIHDLSVIDELSEVAPTYVARGNGDDGSGGRPVQPEDPRLREGWLLELAGLLVGHRAHGPRPRRGRVDAGAGECSATAAARDLDVMIFGDTHSEWVEWVDGVLCVNPGSPTLPRNLRARLGTIGFLEIANGRPRPRHLAAHRARHRRVRLGALAPPGLTAPRYAAAGVRSISPYDRDRLDLRHEFLDVLLVVGILDLGSEVDLGVEAAVDLAHLAGDLVPSARRSRTSPGSRRR